MRQIKNPAHKKWASHKSSFGCILGSKVLLQHFVEENWYLQQIQPITSDIFVFQDQNALKTKFPITFCFAIKICSLFYFTGILGTNTSSLMSAWQSLQRWRLSLLVPADDGVSLKLNKSHHRTSFLVRQKSYNVPKIYLFFCEIWCDLFSEVFLELHIPPQCCWQLWQFPEMQALKIFQRARLCSQLSHLSSNTRKGDFSHSFSEQTHFKQKQMLRLGLRGCRSRLFVKYDIVNIVLKLSITFLSIYRKRSKASTSD